jgi:hypothetical protein
MIKNCEYKYRCKFVTEDCNEIADNCRIHNRYEREAKEKKEHEAEQRRIHENTDIGLVKRLNGWHEGKVV